VREGARVGVLDPILGCVPKTVFWNITMGSYRSHGVCPYQECLWFTQHKLKVEGFF
jgi:hypothetical protein